MGWSQNLFRVLWRALSKEVKEQVGTDRFGNKYYYIPEYKNWREFMGQSFLVTFSRVAQLFGAVSFMQMLTGQTIREKRIVESANKREIDYEVGDIPTEWEDKDGHLIPVRTLELSQDDFIGEHLWTALSLFSQMLEYGSKVQEIMKNEKYKEEIKMKTKDFYEKEKLLREESNKEHLAPPVQTQIKGHASAPDFGKEESLVAPTSTGKTFQPGSWMPQDGKSHNQ
eukprot:bmy_11407T0